MGPPFYCLGPPVGRPPGGPLLFGRVVLARDGRGCAGPVCRCGLCDGGSPYLVAVLGLGAVPDPPRWEGERIRHIRHGGRVRGNLTGQFAPDVVGDGTDGEQAVDVGILLETAEVREGEGLLELGDPLRRHQAVPDVLRVVVEDVTARREES